MVRGCGCEGEADKVELAWSRKEESEEQSSSILNLLEGHLQRS